MVDDARARRRLSRRTLLRGGAATVPALALRGGAASAAPGSAAAASVPAVPLALARVWPGVDGLPGWLDDTHRTFRDGSIEAVLWPGDLGRLQELGLRVSVTSTDLAARDRRLAAAAGGRPAALPAQPGEVSDYRRLADVERELAELVAKHPSRARLFELPFTTAEGRRVRGIEIADDVAAVDGRPTFHIDGVHHAREWPAVEMSMMWAYDLLESTDPRIANLRAHVRTTIVPVVNPDGFQHSRETAAGQGGEGSAAGGRGQYWRKNRRSLTDAGLADPATPAPLAGVDAYGVDPNRNYAATWGRPGSSSSDIHSQSHRGAEPFSEPESRNIAWLASTRHVTGAFTHHTYANEIIWPWANEMGPVPDGQLYLDLGKAMGAFNGYTARKYNTSEGTTPDHLYLSVAAIAFLFEHGGSEFHPAYASFIPQTYAKNREAFLLGCEELCLLPELRSPRTALPAGLLDAQGRRRLHHSVVTGRVLDATGAPVAGAELVLRKRYRSQLWLFGNGATPGGRKEHEEVFEARTVTGPDGSFAWHVNPSTRPHVQRAGGEESYELTVLSSAGGTARRVTVARGQIADLGTLVVS